MHIRRLKGKKLGRKKAPRKALLRSLATSLVLYEKIDTTKAKAKEVQIVVEKLITEAKKGTLASTRRVDSYLLHKNASKKLTTELAPVYKDRRGGYTRVIKLGPRVGDSAPMARIELLDTEKILKTEQPKNKKTKQQKEKTTKKEDGKKTDKESKGKTKAKTTKK